MFLQNPTEFLKTLIFAFVGCIKKMSTNFLLISLNVFFTIGEIPKNANEEVQSFLKL